MITDKMKQFFTDCADAIRYKIENSEKINPADMPTLIKSIADKPAVPNGEYNMAIVGLEGEPMNAVYIAIFGQATPRRFAANKTVNIVELLGDVTTIPYSFFDGSNVKTLILKGFVDTIEANAFQNCKIEKFVTNREEENTIPERVTVIPENCFRENTTTKDIVLHDNIQTIKSFAFYQAGPALTIKNTKLPEELVTIESYAFGSQQIPLTEIPAKVKTIQAQAFANNYAITELTFKGTPTTIANNVFSGCSTITKINVPWASGAVSGAPWGAANATINYNYTG